MSDITDPGVARVYDLINIAFPMNMPFSDQYGPGLGPVQSWISKGKTPEQIAADMNEVLAAIPAPSSEADGGMTYKRRAAFLGHLNVQTLFDHYERGETTEKPTVADAVAYVLADAVLQPQAKPTETPAETISRLKAQIAAIKAVVG